MEEIIILVFRTVFGALIWLLVDFLVYTVLYIIGWCSCKLVTFGYYPRHGIREICALDNYIYTQSLISFYGFSSVCVIIFLLYSYQV